MSEGRAEASVKRPPDRASSGGFRFYAGVHDLSEVPDAVDDELTSWLPFSQARPVLDEIAAQCRAAATPLEITSDDGFRSDFTLLTPYVLDRGLAASFFIVSEFLDRPGRLTVSHLREMHRLGMKIGLHGARHINWRLASPETRRDDIAEGKDRLEQVLGTEVTSVAVPFGAYNGPVVRHLLARGLSEICISTPGLAYDPVPLRPRNMLKAGTLDAVRAASKAGGTMRDALRCGARYARALVAPPWTLA